MRKLIFISYALFLCINVFSQHIYSDTTWERWYGIQNYEEGSASKKDDIEHYDKGYVFYGRYGLGNPDKPFIKKSDINGFFLWERKLDSISDKYILSMKNTDDGGIAICGGVNDIGYSNPWVAKLNACMEIEWCKIFRWSEYSYAIDLEIDKNGDVIVLTAYYGNSPDERVNLIKLTPDGDLIWKENYATIVNYPYIWNAEGNDLYIANDNKYYIAGEAEWPTNNDPEQGGGKRAFFVKVDSDGKEQWVLPFGIYNELYGISLNLFQMTDNKFLSIGRNYINNNPILHYFNSDGEELYWYTNEFMPDIYHNNGLFSSKKISDTSFFALWGYFYSPNEPMGHVGYMVFDTSLNILNYKEDDRWFSPSNLIKTYNNKLVTVATMKESNRYVYHDIYLSKRNIDFSYDTVYTNWSGAYDSLCEGGVVSGYLPYSCEVVVGINEIPNPHEYKEAQEKVKIHIQPNPANKKTEIKLGNPGSLNNLEMVIFNTSGEKVYLKPIQQFVTSIPLNVSNWSQGVYFVVIQSNGKFVGNAKFVVE